MSSDISIHEKNEKTAIIRVDGSQSIGIGHIMRCVALAEGLRDNGIEPVFVMKNSNPSVINIVKKNGFQLKLLPVCLNIYEDISLTQDTARYFRTSLIFTDLGYLITSSDSNQYSLYHTLLKTDETYVVTLDVLYNGQLSSDLVINPYFINSSYLVNVNKEKNLQGPDFFLLRKEYIKSLHREKEIRQNVTNILISFGGSDLKNTTGMVIHSLIGINIHPLHVRILLGPEFPESFIQDINEKATHIKGDVEILSSGVNMADLFTWADLAILGGGLTKYESAATGTPAIVIAQFESDIKPNIEFASAGTLQYLGYIDSVKENDITDAVTKISADYPRRVQMSKNGKALVDGEGMKRILEKIPKEVFL